jgi:hypothetical protein
MTISTNNGAVRTLLDLPSPRGLPILGNALQLDLPRLHLDLEKWAEEFGSMFTIRLGPKRIFVCSDADLLQTALRERPDRYRRFSPIRTRSAGVRGAPKPLPIGGMPGNGRKLIVGESSAQGMDVASAASTEPKRAVSVNRASVGARLISSSVSAARAAAGPKRRLSYAFSRGALLCAMGEKCGRRCQVAKPKPAASTGSRASARAIKRTL